MKRIAATAITLCAIATAMASESVKWLETKHNFGAFDEDNGPVSTVFRFVNTGTEAVAITAARASCGCTAPEYSREAILPGDTASVRVTYDPAGRPGRFTKYVAVDLSMPGSRQKLYVSGTVVGSDASVGRTYPVTCTPMLRLERGGAMMGEVLKGQLRTIFVKAYNSSHDSITPSVTGLPEYIEASVAPEKVAPGEQCSLILYFRSDRCPLYGLVTDTAYVSPDPLSSTLCPLPVTAIVNEDFSKLTPKQLKKAPSLRVENASADFGTLPPAGTASRTVEISNTGKSPLAIRRLYTTDPGVSATVDTRSVKPGRKATVTITVDRDRLPGALLNARISLITNDPLNPVQTIRAVGLLP